MTAVDALSAYRMAFREWFGLSPTEAEILVVLYDAGGALMQPHQIADAAGGRAGSVTVHLAVLRSTLEAEAIDCVRGAGYRLTEQGIAECRAALWTVGEELRRAS